MMRFLLTILLLTIPLHAATRITKQASDFTVVESGWTFVTDSDTPEGSWKALLTANATVSATIQLDQNLPAGVYLVWFKFLDYDQSHRYYFTFGGGLSATNTFDDRDSDTTYWTLPVRITNSASASSLVFNVIRSSLHDARLMAAAISDNLNDFIFRDDRLMNFSLPTAGMIDTTSAVAGNRIPNGSFELGVTPFWRFLTANTATRTNYMGDLWSTDYAYHGVYSMKIPVPATGNFELASIPLTFRTTNKLHTVSVRVKCPSAAATCNLYVYSMYDAPSGFTPTYAWSSSATVAPFEGWKTISVSFTNYFYPNGQYYITFLNQKVTSDTASYWDGLIVNEGTNTVFSPMYDYEFDVQPSHISKVLHTSESPSLTLKGYNNSAGSLTRTVHYEIRNATNGLSVSNTVSLVVGATNSASTTISLSTNELGHFRGSFWITNQNSETELSWLLIDPPGTTSADTNSGFGVHVDNRLNGLGTAQRLGAKHQIGVSTGRIRWSEVETSSGVYSFPSVSDYSTYGITYIANLCDEAPVTNAVSTPSLTGWIPTVSDVITYWPRWVTNCVANYGTNVWGYEICNEPDQGSQYLPGSSAEERLTNYAARVNLAAPLIKTYNPAAVVIAGGGVLTTNHLGIIWNNLSNSVKSQIDFWSVHIYPGNESVASSLKTFADGIGVTLWNTESGATDKGAYTGSRMPFRTAGEYVIDWKSGDLYYDAFDTAVSEQAKNFLQNMAYGIMRQSFYDLGQRNIGVSDFNSRQFTTFDYDDSIRPKGAAVTTIYKLLDKSTGKGTVSQDSRLSAFGYLVGSTPYVAFWGSSNLTVALTGVSTSDIKVYDLMGNGATPASVSLKAMKMPQIVKGQGALTIGTLTNAFWGATVSGQSDTQAPTLSLAQVPRATGIVWRWFALDDSGAPSESDQESIQYRYSLDGSAFTSWSGDTWVEQSANSIIVQARDGAGNTSEASYSLSGSTPPTPLQSTNPPVVIGGNARLRGVTNIRIL